MDPICGLPLDEGCTIPLPVELISFEAMAVRESDERTQGVELTWQTLSEINNAGFEIERGVDGGRLESIGFVAGSGTTNEPHWYSFSDIDLPFEAFGLSYRLRQTDFDGSHSYSPIVEVDLNLPAALVLRGNFPNPFSEKTTIRFELPASAYVHLAVYDVVGREVAVLVNGQQQPGRKSVTVDLPDLPDGVYFYGLKSESGVELVGRMIRIR